MNNRSKVEKIEYDLESKIPNYYEATNPMQTGMLEAHIIKLAREYYELTGNFYRRTWKEQNYNNRKI